MIDRIGHTIEIGDIVVMPHRHGYVDLQIGRVTGFTPQNVRVDVFNRENGETDWYNAPGKRMIQPQGLVSITGVDALAYVLKNG